jgi:hypothetical protein
MAITTPPDQPSARSPNRWFALVAMGLGLLLAFAIGELGVRLFVDFADEQPRRVEGVDPEHPTRFLAGTSHRYQSQEFDYTVEFNRFGRRDIDWDEATIQDPTNILFIGDSFVLGNGLEHEETIPTQLEGQLAQQGRKAQVFNFGLPGGGPREYLGLFEEAVKDGFAASTVVVMLFVGNDFYPSVLDDPLFDAERRKELIRQRDAAPTPGLRSQLIQFVRLRLAQSAAAVDIALRLSDLLGIQIYSSPTSYIFQRRLLPEQQETFDAILASLEGMQRLAEESSRHLLVVVSPNRVQVENTNALTTATMEAAAPNRRIMQLCDTLELQCLDLLPLLAQETQRTSEALYYPIDRHWTPRGASFVTSAIGALLLERDGPPR